MAFSEDIILRLGLDPRNFNKELRGARGTLQAFGRQLGGLFVAGGASAIGRKVLQYADDISTMSATIGTSSEFLQGWQDANMKSGVAVEKSTMGLQRFSRRLGEAQQGTGVLKDVFGKLNIPLKDAHGNFRSMEDVLMDYGDSIANTKNQQEQLRLAFLAFDSEGAQMVGTLKQGSKAVRQLIDDSVKLTNQDVQDLANANVAIDRFARKATIAAGKGASAFTKFGEGLGSIFGAVSGGSSFARATVDYYLDQMKVDSAVKSTGKHTSDIKDTKKEILDIDQAEEIAIFKLRDVEENRLATQEAILRAKKEALDVSRSQAFADRSAGTVGELASLRPGDPLFSPAAIPNILKAREVQRLEMWSKGARFAGNTKGAAAATQRALDMRHNLNALTSSEQNPLGALAEQQKETNTKLADLLEREAALGLNIHPHNGN